METGNETEKLNLQEFDCFYSDLDTLHGMLNDVEYSPEYQPIFKAISERTHVSVSVVKELLGLLRSAAAETYNQEIRKRNEQATRSA